MSLICCDLEAANNKASVKFEISYSSDNIIFLMKDDIKHKLGRNIKVERIRKYLSQEQFAEMIDMSVSHVSKLEQGLTSPSAIALFKMSKILNIPMEEFFKDIDV